MDLGQARARFADELSDPRVRAQFYNLIANEAGGQGAVAQQAFAETVMNRALARGQTLQQAVNDHGYYPAQSYIQRPGRDYSDIVNEVMTGSDITGGATGNASGKVRFAGGPQTFAAQGERFGVEGADQGWQDRISISPRPSYFGGVPDNSTATNVPGVVTATPPLREVALRTPEDQWMGSWGMLPGQGGQTPGQLAAVHQTPDVANANYAARAAQPTAVAVGSPTAPQGGYFGAPVTDNGAQQQQQEQSNAAAGQQAQQAAQAGLNNAMARSMMGSAQAAAVQNNPYLSYLPPVDLRGVQAQASRALQPLGAGQGQLGNYFGAMG